jgi:hypothetical protein
MELDYGKGRLIWCGLDLEEHTGLDPAAHRVARQLMQYAATSRLSPKAASVSYLGGEDGRKLLDSLGVLYTPAQTLDSKSSLILLGQDAQVRKRHYATMYRMVDASLCCPARTQTLLYRRSESRRQALQVHSMCPPGPKPLV